MNLTICTICGFEGYPVQNHNCRPLTSASTTDPCRPATPMDSIIWGAIMEYTAWSGVHERLRLKLVRYVQDEVDEFLKRQAAATANVSQCKGGHAYPAARCKLEDAGGICECVGGPRLLAPTDETPIHEVRESAKALIEKVTKERDSYKAALIALKTQMTVGDYRTAIIVQALDQYAKTVEKE